MKTILPLILMVAFATSVDASPIDDASKYSVRVKSTVRYAFAGESAAARMVLVSLSIDKEVGF